MTEIRRILYPTDFSPCAREALGPALSLAERHGAELHLFHALVLLGDDPNTPWHRFPDPEQVEGELRDQAEQRMKEALRNERNHTVKIHRAQRRAISPLEAILEYADENKIDLIVMGTHGRGTLGRLLLGSVTREVVRLATCPVLTVREHGPTKPAFAPKKILVPVDFSEHSTLALDHARALATSYSSRIDVLYVVEETLYPDFYYPVVKAPKALTPEMRNDLLRQLRDWLGGDEENGQSVGLHVSAGRAGRQICDFADAHDSDLIVMASHGRTGLRRMLLGSVAEGIVSHARCPVLTVKAFGREIEGSGGVLEHSEPGPATTA